MNRSIYGRIWDKLHLGKLSIFAALSVADLFMTYQLVQASDGEVYYESNPVADAWLSSYGWVGLSIYKALAVLLVIMCAVYVSFHRPRLGGRLLLFACLATGAVVGYSYCLAREPRFSQEITSNDKDIVAHKGRMLENEMRRQRSYQALLGQLGQDLIEQHCTLDEAIQRLFATEKARNPEWVKSIQRNYPGCSADECLAIHLGQHTLAALQHDTQRVESVADQLEREYKAKFGRPYPIDLLSGMYERAAAPAEMRRPAHLAPLGLPAAR